jgi:hypothetical protein
MFRLIASNAQQGFKPSLLLKVKHAKNTTKFASATQPAPVDSNNNTLINYQIRNKSTATRSTPPPTRSSIPEDASYQPKYRNRKPRNYKPARQSDYDYQHFVSKSFEEIQQYQTRLQEGTFKSEISEQELFRYATDIYNGTINLRRKRLGKTRNRDRDEKDAFVEDLAYQTAILSLAELIISGELNHALSARSLFKVFGTLLQFKLNTEVLNLWETGVNSEQGKLFLSHPVLSVVIQVGYETKRFNYDEIKQIYDMSVVPNEPVHPFLSDRTGQVAISEGDHARGLDALESMMTLYEKNPNEESVLGGLAQLHLSFIGHCKDIAIAKRFFEKAITPGGLPYVVALKSPYMVSFFENCSAAGDSMEEIIDLWARISRHYEQEGHALFSKNASICNGLFKVFFTKYPEPTPEAKELLHLIFRINPPANEILSNTLISNMPWEDKEFFQEIAQSYDRYGIDKTMVCHRIILKQAGHIEFSNEEILDLWNQLLRKLDDQEYFYIANADWSALRAATMFSDKFKEQRTPLYLSILKTYKDYMQHDYAAKRFLRNWIKDPSAYKSISKISTESNPTFEGEIKIEVPEFKNLRRNISYREATKEIIDSTPLLID